ncbi:MAG: hypothetical protein ACJ760_16640 [Thermoleophilaceae bacterium]
MTRLAGMVSTLVALVAVVVIGPATATAAQSPNPKPVSGRNFVGAQIDASIDPYKQLNLLSTRVVNDGKTLNVWLVSRPKNCGGWDLATAKLPIADDGTFHGTLTFGTAPANVRGTATFKGHFATTKRNGLVALTTIRSRFASPNNCDTGTVHIKAISPRHGHKGGGQPAPNALFVGMTSQSSARIEVKLPMLALISADGTKVKRFVADTNVRCKSGRPAGGLFRIRDIPIKDDAFNGVTGDTEPVQGTDRKRTIVLGATGTFGERILTGTWRVHQVETDPYSINDDCDTGDLKYVAARVR